MRVWWARRGGKVVSPAVGISAFVSVLAAGVFVLGYLEGGGASSPAWQATVKFLRDLPIAVAVCYTCLIQARRYRAARDRGWRRRWFKRAPYVIGVCLAGGAIGEIVLGSAVLDVERNLPAEILAVDFARYVSLSGYAALGFIVYGKAAVSSIESFGLKARVQNALGAVALAILAVVPLHTFTRVGAQVFLPEGRLSSVMGAFTDQQFVLLAACVTAVVVGLGLRFSKTEEERFANRLLRFLGLTGSLARSMANAPIGEQNLYVPYACLREAAGKEFLGLPEEDKRRAENAFRVAAILKADENGDVSGLVGEDQLLHLAKLYEEELGSPRLVEGLSVRGADAVALPSDDVQGVVREAVELVLSIRSVGSSGVEDSGVPKAGEWKQLVCVAVTDGGLLPSGRREESVLSGVCQRVFEAYELARYKVYSYTGEMGDLFDDKTDR